MKNRIRISKLLVAASVALFTNAAIMEEAEANEATFGALYTVSARDRNGGDRQIRARINQRIVATNRTSRKSKTNFSVKRVAIWRSKYKESGLTLLGNFYDLFGGGPTDNEKLVRNEALRMEARKKTDLICLITTEKGGGGSPGAVGWAGLGWASAVSADHLQNQVIPHELGHNYAADHNKGKRMQTADGSVYTVMWPTVQSKWAEHYSNPDVKYKRTYVTGSAELDNATKIRRRAPVNASRK